MNRLIILLISLACVVDALGQVLLFGRRPVAATAACATSDTTLPHDFFLEGFEVATTGYENTWTAGGTPGGVTYNPAADTTSLTTGKPIGACDQALRVTVAMADGNEDTIYWNSGGNDVDARAADFYFHVYIVTPPDGAEDLTIICGKNTTVPTSASGSSFQLILKQSGGNAVLMARGTTDSAEVTGLALNTWHKVKMHIDPTAASSSMSVNDDTPVTFTRRTGVDPTYLHVGSADAATAGDSADFYLDLITVELP